VAGGRAPTDAADMLMVKPGLANLDVLARLRERNCRPSRCTR
jgi:delta-aminolevulinic acid dehydratase/porphobilinogen synthase